MRVLALGHTAELGGAEIGLANMARHLPAGLRVVLLEDGPLVHRLRAAASPVEVCDLSAALAPPLRSAVDLPPRARALRELRRAILDRVESYGADVLLLNTLRVTRLVAACALPPRVRIVTMLRDGLGPPHLSRRDAVVDQVAVNAVSTSAIANFFTSPARMRVMPRCQSSGQSRVGHCNFGAKSWKRLIGPATIVGKKRMKARYSAKLPAWAVPRYRSVA